jgi:hypothetical protein
MEKYSAFRVRFYYYYLHLGPSELFLRTQELESK